jgi:acyl-[acyl-carrier-protein] desaturase
VDMRSIEVTIHHLLSRGFESRNKGDDTSGLIYAAFQERATRITHGNVAKMAGQQGEENLARICRKIASDETRHETFYTRIVGQIMERDPESAILAFRSMLKGIIAMPGRFMFDGQDPDLYDHFSTVSQRIGAYTVVTYAEIIEHLVEVWDVAHRSLSGKAAKAQEYLCHQADKYYRFADEVSEKLARQPLAHFSWLPGCQV